MSYEDGTFARVFRGYDPDEVDKALSRLRRELMLAKTEIDKQTIAISELTEQIDTLAGSLQQVGKPTFSGLGKELVSTLSTAEKQAAELISQATADAYNIKMASDREQLRATQAAEDTAREIENVAKQAAYEALTSAQNRVNKLLLEAEKSAKRIISEAEREATDVHRRATTEVARERADAARQIASERAETEREMAEFRLVTAAQVKQNGAEVITDEILSLLKLEANRAVAADEQERELLRRHASAVVSTEKYVDEAKKLVESLQIRKLDLTREIAESSAENEAQMASLRQAVDARALEILSQANSQSESVIELAKDRARDIIATAESQLASLNNQRDILSKHLDTITTIIQAAKKTAASAKKPVASAKRVSTKKNVTANTPTARKSRDTGK